MAPNHFGGMIHINPSLLPQEFPPDFFLALSVLRGTLSRNCKGGCSPIIALFLAYAVERARQVYQRKRLTIHCDVDIPWVQMQGVGLVGGRLDFMTADAKGFAPMGTFVIFEMTYSGRSPHE
jgi:hypothetical protein